MWVFPVEEIWLPADNLKGMEQSFDTQPRFEVNDPSTRIAVQPPRSSRPTAAGPSALELTRVESTQSQSRLAGARLAAVALLAQLVEHLHGKEGVAGSSPAEGFTETASTS